MSQFISRSELESLAALAGFTRSQFNSPFNQEKLRRLIRDVRKLELNRICKAIKDEDDYCVDHGDYMLDSDDCIAVARGTWKRPDYSVDSARGQK